MPHYLFTGINQYTLSQQIHTRVSQFQQKYGTQGYYHFDSQNFDVKKIIESISSTGLFQEKKMIVITGVPADKKAENKISIGKIDELLNRYETHNEYINDDVMIIRVSIDPDKRTKGYKYLSTHTQVKEFKAYSTKELIAWIHTLIDNLIDTSDITHIIDMVGTDMYRLQNECHKLKHFALQHQVPKLNIDDIKKLIWSQEDENVFGLLHAIICKPDQAYQELIIAQTSGVDRNKYHGGLMWGLRTLCLVTCSYLGGNQNSSTIAGSLKLNARAVSTILKQYQINQKLYDQVKDLLEKMIGLEYQIKVGMIPDTQYRLQVKQLITQLQSS